MQLKGLFYRKLGELTKAGKKEEKHIKKDIKNETRKAVGKLEIFVENDIKKIRRDFDSKFSQIMDGLKVLNKLNKDIIEKNQSLINQLKKRKK